MQDQIIFHPSLIIILGATATGKTSTAIKLAQRLNSPILSADSRQVYRHFDIGTAKPTLTDRQGIPHYLIDIAEPDTTLTLAEYQEQAQQLIAEFHAQELTPILVGGTGLYIQAIALGLKMPRVAPQIELRSQLQTLGQKLCYATLQQVDPPSAHKIHPNDQVRTLRALEVYYVTGIPLSTQQSGSPPDYPIVQIGLSAPDVPIHRQWISDRLEQMLRIGWLDEIKQLQSKYGENLPLLQTLGYAEMGDYLSGKTNLNEAKELAVTHTCQFAKRQKTWFRGAGSRDNLIHWVSSDISVEELLQIVKRSASTE